MFRRVQVVLSLAALAAVLGCGGGGAPEPSAPGGGAPARYRFSAGDVRRYRLVVEEFPLSAPGGLSTLPDTTVSTVLFRETVEEVTPEGVASIRIDVEGGTRGGRAAGAVDEDLPPVGEAFHVHVAPDGGLQGGGAVPAPLWLLPSLPAGGEETWDQKVVFGRREGIVWHLSARHGWTGGTSGSAAVRSAIVLVGDRHVPGSNILHDPSTTCATCDVVADGRGVGDALLDLDGGAVREARQEWAVRIRNPGPGRVDSVYGRRLTLVRLDE